MSPRVIILLGSHTAALVLGFTGFNLAIHQPHLKRDQALVLQAERKARNTEATVTTIARAVRDTHDTHQEKVRYVTQEVIRAVPLYLPADRPPGMSLPGVREAGPGGAVTAEVSDTGVGAPGGHLPVGLVRLHDYAALGVNPPVPSPSGEPLWAASSVDLPALAATLGSNYGVCHGDRAEVMAWREWYRKEAAAWPVR